MHRDFGLSPCSVFFLSDDGPESSFLGTKKPHNKLILCGLVFFGLLLAGICPTRQVEMEGLEPSSKRGTNEFSTCLFSDWFSWWHRPETANADPYPLKSRKLRAAFSFLFPICLHRRFGSPREEGSRAMSCLCNCCGD